MSSRLKFQYSSCSGLSRRCLQLIGTQHRRRHPHPTRSRYETKTLTCTCFHEHFPRIHQICSIAMSNIIYHSLSHTTDASPIVPSIGQPEQKTHDQFQHTLLSPFTYINGKFFSFDTHASEDCKKPCITNTTGRGPGLLLFPSCCRPCGIRCKHRMKPSGDLT